MENQQNKSKKNCKVCTKQFHAFRRPKLCNICGEYVCSSCSKNRKSFDTNDKKPVRVCDQCINRLSDEGGTHQPLARSPANRASHSLPENQMQNELRQANLQNNQTRRESLSDEALNDILPLTTATATALAPEGTICQAIDDIKGHCHLCEATFEPKTAIIITGCDHQFHWACLKEYCHSQPKEKPSSCPVCHTVLEDLLLQKTCQHPRVRKGHKYCRDCGERVSEKDVKPLPDEESSTTTAPQSTYSGGVQGAVVRCPTCLMQLRVLPHMYNTRVACPSGHQFHVAIAPSSQTTGTNNDTRSNDRRGYPGLMH